MDALNQLTASIVERTQAEVDAAVAAKEVALASELEQFTTSAQAKRETQQQAFALRVAQEQANMSQRLSNETRNAVLAHKQQLLSSLYDKAIAKMMHWDEEQLLHFITSVCAQYDDSQRYTLILGEHSAFVRDSLPARLPSHIAVVAETIPGQGGFILSADGIEYNYCFSNLMNDLQKEFATTLASRAFDNN